MQAGVPRLDDGGNRQYCPTRLRRSLLLSSPASCLRLARVADSYEAMSAARRLVIPVRRAEHVAYPRLLPHSPNQQDPRDRLSRTEYTPAPEKTRLPEYPAESSGAR